MNHGLYSLFHKYTTLSLHPQSRSLEVCCFDKPLALPLTLTSGGIYVEYTYKLWFMYMCNITHIHVYICLLPHVHMVYFTWTLGISFVFRQTKCMLLDNFVGEQCFSSATCTDLALNMHVNLHVHVYTNPWTVPISSTTLHAE